MAMENGADKYGAYNWRAKHVRYSIYLDAIERHVMALRDGEDHATDSGVHHLGHIMACAAILADAVAGQFLVDDRPPQGPAAKLILQLTRGPHTQARKLASAPTNPASAPEAPTAAPDAPSLDEYVDRFLQTMPPQKEAKEGKLSVQAARDWLEATGHLSAEGNAKAP